MQGLNFNNGKMGFVESFNNEFTDANHKTAQEQKDFIFSIANQCRGWYLPEFADEHKYLPVSKPVNLEKLDDGEIVEIPIVQVGALTSGTPATTIPSSVGIISAKDLTVPPNKKMEDKFLKYVLLGVGAIIVYKLFLD